MTHLRQRMLDELQRRNYATTTVESYIHAVERFARHFKRRPDRLNQDHLRTYQAYLLRERKLEPADREAPCLGAPLLLREDAETALCPRRHPVSEGPASAPTRFSRVEEVIRLIDAARQSVAPHDADDAVFHGHAQRGDCGTCRSATSTAGAC